MKEYNEGEMPGQTRILAWHKSVVEKPLPPKGEKNG